MLLRRFIKNELISALLTGIISWIVSGAILILIGTLICAKAENPSALLHALAYFALYLSCFTGGVFSCDGENEKKNVLIFALTVFAIFLLSSPFSHIKRPLPLSALLYSGTLLSALAGGFIRSLIKAKNAGRRKRNTRMKRHRPQ